MSLTTRTPISRCGKPYATEDEALNSKLGRAGDRLLVPCGEHFHLRKPASAPAPQKAPRDTGPSRSVRALVLERDGYRCARCGRPAGPGIGPYSLQHRLARGVGGDSSPSNLVVLCGSATTLCHGEVEARKSRDDIDHGYRLESPEDPRLIPVDYFMPDGSGFSRYLADNGDLLESPPEVTG